MATLKDFRDERLRKLEELKELGFNPYPADSHRTDTTGQILADFAAYENKPVTVAGRIVAIRKFGKLAFVVVKDTTGQIQLYLNEAEVQPRDASVTALASKTCHCLILVISLKLLERSAKARLTRSLSLQPNCASSARHFVQCQPKKKALPIKKSVCVAVTST